MRELENLKRQRDELLSVRSPSLAPSLKSGPTPSPEAKSAAAESPDELPEDEDEKKARQTFAHNLTFQEKVEVDEKTGQLKINGKLTSEAAIEQRLRRWTSTKKSGKISSGKEIQDMFQNLETRPDLVALFKECKLNKAGPSGVDVLSHVVCRR